MLACGRSCVAFSANAAGESESTADSSDALKAHRAAVSRKADVQLIIDPPNELRLVSTDSAVALLKHSCGAKKAMSQKRLAMAPRLSKLHAVGLGGILAPKKKKADVLHFVCLQA